MNRNIFLIFTFLLISCSFNSLADSSKINKQTKEPVITRFFNISEITFAKGIADIEAEYSRYFFGGSTMIGHGIVKNLDGAIGAGIYSYNGGTLFPVFIDLRFNHDFAKITAFINGSGGVLLDFSASDSGRRIFGNPGLGIRFPLTSSLDGNLSAGLFVQALDKNKTHDSFINLKLGIRYLFRK